MQRVFPTIMHPQGLPAHARNGLLPNTPSQTGPNPNRTHSQGACQKPPNMFIMHFPAMGGGLASGFARHYKHILRLFPAQTP